MLFARIQFQILIKLYGARISANRYLPFFVVRLASFIYIPHARTTPSYLITFVSRVKTRALCKRICICRTNHRIIQQPPPSWPRECGNAGTTHLQHFAIPGAHHRSRSSSADCRRSTATPRIETHKVFYPAAAAAWY